jgi:DNA-binding PadR family transcriptional regulator
MMMQPRGRGRRPDDLERLAALRHMHREGPLGGGARFDHPFGGGRGRARRGDVRTAVLLLLAEEPRNGYQLMQAIEERTGGRWRPSPGSVYPTLAQLEDEGLVNVSEAEGAKRFALTEAGREQLASRPDDAPLWDATDDPGAHSFSELRSLVIQIGKAARQVSQVGDERQTARASELLAQTRRGLYRILAEDTDE